MLPSVSTSKRKRNRMRVPFVPAYRSARSCGDTGRNFLYGRPRYFSAAGSESGGLFSSLFPLSKGNHSREKIRSIAAHALAGFLQLEAASITRPSSIGRFARLILSASAASAARSLKRISAARGSPPGLIPPPA